MASFRNGFKIFGEFSIKQGLGRIRSFSEDRKPGRWLPEDQWAVRQPGSTCPDPCKPKKPPKPSKSWLSICKDPEPPIPCDIRHNNCPPPPPPKEGPWYSLDNLIPKKKPEKPPPLHSCREEKKRREAEGEDEVCEKFSSKRPLDIKPDDEDTCCMPKPDPCPAPVVNMSCPLPKELDIMLWCGRPSTDRSRIAMKCQSDRLPYEEFRPQKCWKPPPFSLPCKTDPPPAPSFNRGSISFAEFKHVEVPRPLYTRYKSVELCDQDFLLCMVEVKCPDDDLCCLPAPCPAPSCCPPPKCCPAPCPSTPPPCRRPCLPPCCRVRPQPKPDPETLVCPEKRVIEAASCKPVKIKKATKYTFRPKPTKFIERRVLKNPLASCKCSNPESRPEKENEEKDSRPKRCKADEEPPKVITGTLTQEPQVYERDFCASNPPRWMYVLCKPGSKDTPLVPKCDKAPREPDWSSETDGLNFYDNKNENIKPKPPPDPYKQEVKAEEKPAASETPVNVEIQQPPSPVRSRLVLMPEQYNIKYSRPEDPCAARNECESTSIDEFIQAKTAATKKCTKSYPQMKENILYDLQRLCPSPPLDPTKLNVPCLKPVEDPCAPRFFRCYSTFSPIKLRNLTSVQLQKTQGYSDCGDSASKCKAGNLTPPGRTCKEPKPKPACAEIALPCCRKARIPPSCSVRKPMPPCKKKLPPKPSFSECAKDPPPCPKITECNAWEKKRKYSDWAVMKKGNDKISQNFEKAGFVKSLESQAKEVYANRVKCRTLKPKHNALGIPNKNNIVLGLNDDAACDYEQRNVMLRQKKIADPIVSKDNQFFLRDKVDTQTTGLTKPHMNLKIGGIMESEDVNENYETLNTPEDEEEEEDKEISKDFMGSIGSWINDLFNVPPKRPATVPQITTTNREQELQEMDDEYLKSLNVFKEKLKKKLKSETTVYLTGDKFLELNFDKSSDRKGKRKSNWMSSSGSNHTVGVLKMSPDDPNAPVHKFPIKISEKENIYVNLPLEGRTDFYKPILMKDNSPKNKRSEKIEREEYLFATASEPSKNLLLNINDPEKFSQVYKNAHLGIQEPQPYKQRRANSYQHNARCYTTNANLSENSKANSLMTVNKKNKRSLFHMSDTSDACAANENARSKKNSIKLKKRKSFSEMTGEESLKSFHHLHSESVKNESKTSSDDLVKNLIKKTKVTSRPQLYKKKSKSLVTVSSPKNRFMQSATTSLVVNVLAKKENDLLLSLKAGSKVPTENKILKPDRGIKEWPPKHRDIRFEIKKVISSRFNKSTYLNDMKDKPENNPQNDNASFRPMKRITEEPWYLKDQGDRNKKVQDIKQILSRLDHRYDTFKSREKSKKTERENEQGENQDVQNARFQKQHETFRNTLKVAQQTLGSEANEKAENAISDKLESSNTTESPAEVIVLNTEIQPTSEKPKEIMKYEMAEPEKQNTLSSLSQPFENESDVIVDSVCTNEKPPSPKLEKPKTLHYKNKLVKTKSLQYLKEDDMRTLLNSTGDVHSDESHNQKQTSKTYERQLPPTEIRPQKTLEPVLLNRSYSTNVLERNQKPEKLIPFSQPKSLLLFSDKNKDDEKKDKEKKKEKGDKTPCPNKESKESCGFQHSKKPGPNCEKSDSS